MSGIIKPGREWFVLAVIFVLAQLPLFSQEARGTLLGRVTDSTGAVIINAKVEGLNTATGVKTNATTNESGDYLLPYLIPGPYTVTVEAPGFRTFKRTEINLRMDDHITVDAAMQLGQASESVEVVASAALLDTSTSSMGNVMGTKTIQDLPLQNGNLYWSAALSPGVVDTNTAAGYVRPIDTGHPSSVSVDGALSGTNQYTIDGAPNMFGNVMAYSPPPGIVEEFKVVGSMFDASYGYFAGATINLSLKSGTNSLHGQTYYFDQTPGLGANLFFNNAKGQSKAVMRLQRWGVTASGPVYIPKVVNGKNKLFFMFGYEGLKSFDPTPFGVSAVPTNSERGGNFSNLLALGTNYQIYDPYSSVATGTGTLQPDSRCPATSFRQARSIRPRPPSPSCGTSPICPAPARGLSNYTHGAELERHLLRLHRQDRLQPDGKREAVFPGGQHLQSPAPTVPAQRSGRLDRNSRERRRSGGFRLYRVPDVLHRRPLQLQPVQADLRPVQHGLGSGEHGFLQHLCQSDQPGDTGEYACRRLLPRTSPPWPTSTTWGRRPTTRTISRSTPPAS